MSNQPRSILYCIKKLFGKKTEVRAAAAGSLKSAHVGVEGMSCSSCEQRIEYALSRRNGIKRVAANLAGASVSLDYDAAIISLEEIQRNIEGLGYKTMPGNGTSADKRKHEGFSPVQLLGIVVIMTAAWLVLDRTGVFNAIPAVNQNMGYGLLFLIGLLTSVHCIAMCGGINLTQAAKGGEQNTASLRNRLLPGLLYNAGRLISYTLIGGAVGALGSVVSFTVGVQAAIIIAAGIFMLLMGVNVLGIFPWMKKLTPRLPKALTGRLTNAVRGKGPLLVGLLNGFMPCGPLQSMQLYALAAGSFLAGAASMFLFALGTAPLMFVFGAVGSLLSRRAGARMMQISALVVLLLGVSMIARGLNLAGINLMPSSAPSNIARLVSGRQSVNSRMTSSSYEPIIVQAGVPVRWTIQAEAAHLNGCNNAITIPRLNITKTLKPGANVIEFLPESSGTIAFTCWMGMITSSIKVVDDLGKVDPGELKTITDQTAGTPNVEFAPFDVPLDVVARAEIRDGVQYLKLTVEGDRYSPAVGILRKGVKASLNFYAETLTEDNYRIIVPAYDARFEVVQGNNDIGLDPEADFFFYNWTGLFYGVVLVADDPAALDRKGIEARIGRLKDEFEKATGVSAGQ